MEELPRIVAKRGICGGKPTIRGTRIMVGTILGQFAGGATMDDILKDYPTLFKGDIVAALEYAREVVEEETLIIPDWS
jgi:uncharacterized protein (DUF433 family)